MLNQLMAPEAVFKALGDPSRLRIVERLGAGEASVTELAAPLAMSLPAVLQHLSVLEASGVISSRKVGRVRLCRIEPTSLTAAEDWFSNRRVAMERALDRLGVYLETTKE
jgi:DNA-binding transcriptional ArsR family regulator